MKPVFASAADRRQRQATGWTRDRIAELIQLYRQSECLWNHYTEHYKSKEHRTKAIESICAALRISKLDFGKKIHNLRNQFNSEMKKMDRRIEEAGGSPESLIASQRCRWEHFEALKFLRTVIEPRPGGFHQTPLPQTGLSVPKKTKFDYTKDKYEQNSMSPPHDTNAGPIISAKNAVEYQIEDATGDDEGDDTSLAEDFQSYDEEFEPQAARQHTYDQKYHTPPPPLKVVPTATAATPQEPKLNITVMTPHTPAPNKPYSTRLQSVHLKKQQTQHSPQQPHHEDNQLDAEVKPLDAGADVELTGALPLSSAKATANSRVTTAGTPTNLFPCLSNQKAQSETPSRDQWDSFGELIASEFRHLNSDMSRKRLKRKIMQAMLEIGEQDDSLCTDTSTN